MSVAVLLTACSEKPQKAPEGKVRHITVLHSWGMHEGEEGQPFTDCMEQAFIDKGVNAEVKHLYMNRKYNSETYFLRRLWDNFRDSINQHNPEVLLVNDDPALDFVMDHYDELTEQWHGAIVFAGINALQQDRLKDFKNMTGYRAKIDMHSNMKMIRDIIRAEEVNVELDDLPYDQRLLQEIMPQSEDTMGICINRVAALNSGSEDYAENLYHSKDMWHLQIKMDAMSNTFLEHANCPQFTAIREQFNNPNRVLFLGGCFTSMETQVNDQVAYCCRILAGETPQSLPVMDHENGLFLDYNAMQKMRPDALSYTEYKDHYVIVNVPQQVANPVGWLMNYAMIYLIATLVLMALLYYVMVWRVHKKDEYVTLKEESRMRSIILKGTKAVLWTVQNDVIRLSNEFVEQMQLPSELLPLEDFGKFVTENSRKSWDAFLNFEKEKGRKHIRLQLDFNGTPHWYEMLYTIDENSIRESFFSGLMMKVDEVVERENKMKDLQEKQEEVSLKQSFLSNISHDLRTPLNAVTGFTQLMTAEDIELSDEELQYYNELIHQNSEVMLNMIDGIMMKSQIQTEEIKMKPTEISAQKFIEATYQTHVILAPKHLEFKEVQDSPDRIVMFDRHRTQQVINNFLSNAFKFTYNGSITVGWHFHEDTEEVEFFCEDTGIGVSEYDRQHLFDRFYKVTEQANGTGLGLDISRTFIEVQGGRIGVESELGKGSKFWFRFKQVAKTILLLLCLALPMVSCQQKEQKRVLVVYSFDKNHRMYGEFAAEVQRTFRDEGYRADMRSVYLDLERPNKIGIDELKHMRDSLQKTKWSPEIILVEGDRALADVLSAQGDSILDSWGEVPIVAGSIHYPDWDFFRKHSNLAIWYDPIDYCANIDLAIELSKINSVVIELDHTPMDSLARRNIRQAISKAPYIDNTDFHIDTITSYKLAQKYAGRKVVNALSVAEPEKNVQGAPDSIKGYKKLHFIMNNAAFFPCLIVKKDMYSDNIASKTNSPEFTCVKADFGDGNGRYMAGYFASYKTVAHDCAASAIEIFRGKTPKELPMQEHHKQKFMDYDAMKVMGWNYEDYKDDFNIINVPLELESPFSSLWTGIVSWTAAALFSGTIIFFVFFFYNRRQKEIVSRLATARYYCDLALQGADSYRLKNRTRMVELAKSIPDEYKSIRSEILSALNKPGEYTFEAPGARSGKLEWWRTRFVVKPDGRAYGLIVNIDSEHKIRDLVENAISATGEAKEKDSFLLQMNKQIRGPLDIITSACDKLTGENPNEEEKKQLFADIQKNSERLTKLINDVLQFSRIESKRLKYEFSAVCVADFCKDFFQKTQGMVPEGVSYELALTRQDVYINTDVNQLYNIFMQYFDNATRYAGTPGCSIYFGWKYQLGKKQVQIFMEDTGIGIEDKKVKDVFDVFWRKTTFSGGVGIGLVIAKELAEALGGHISVSSEHHKGSRFSVWLPAEIR